MERNDDDRKENTCQKKPLIRKITCKLVRWCDLSLNAWILFLFLSLKLWVHFLWKGRRMLLLPCKGLIILGGVDWTHAQIPSVSPLLKEDTVELKRISIYHDIYVAARRAGRDESWQYSWRTGKSLLLPKHRPLSPQWASPCLPLPCFAFPSWLSHRWQWGAGRLIVTVIKRVDSIDGRRAPRERTTFSREREG